MYNGYTRTIISKAPLVVDRDGDVVEDAEDDSNSDFEDAEEDPYKDVRIEGKAR